MAGGEGAPDSDAGGGLPPPPGQQAPFAIITPTNQGGVVVILTALGLAFAFTSLLLRVYIRREFRTKFAWDDILAAMSMLFAVIQSAMIFAAVSRGFGKAIPESSAADLAEWQKNLYVSDILYVLAMWLTKCSVGLLFIRLSPDRRHNQAAKVVLGGATLFMVLSAFLLALRCDGTQPWIFVGTECYGLLTRWQAVASFDVLTELSLFALSMLLVHGLQLSLAKKLVVIFAFGLRLPIIVPAILRLSFMAGQLSSGDRSLNGVLPAICTQAEICLAIITTTTPCLRPFMSALNTNYGGAAGGAGDGTTIGGSKKSSATGGSKGNGGEYSLSSLNGRRNGVIGGGSAGAKSLTAASPTPIAESMARTGGTGYKEDVDVDVDVDAEAGLAHPGRHVAVEKGISTHSSKPSPPTVRWDGVEYKVEVGKGDMEDQGSVGSESSRRQMIISKNTEWSVNYGNKGLPGRAV